MKIEKKHKILSIGLIIAYLTLAILLVINFINLPNSLRQIQLSYIAEVEAAVSTVLQSDHSHDDFIELINKFPMEIAVSRDNEVVFSTVPHVTIIHLIGSVNQDIIIAEAFGPYQGYMIWYVIYDVPTHTFINAFLIRQALIYLAALIGLVTILACGQGLLFNPLRKVKKSVAKLSEYDFEGVEAGEDVVNQGLFAFSKKLKKDIKAVSRKHTKLEQDLQLERQRLNNAITVSSAFVHDLKSPIHHNLIKNEYFLEKLENPSQETIEIIQENIEMNDLLIKTVNEVLTIMKSDFYDVNQDLETIDVSQLTREALKLFSPLFVSKDYLIELEIEEEVTGYFNKATIQLLIHNLISNMAQYALAKSELLIQIENLETEILMIFQNESSLENIKRMKASEQLFNVDKNDDGDFVYSSGNGLLLISDLVALYDGEYQLNIRDTIVEVKIHLPKKGANNEE